MSFSSSNVSVPVACMLTISQTRQKPSARETHGSQKKDECPVNYKITKDGISVYKGR